MARKRGNQTGKQPPLPQDFNAAQREAQVMALRLKGLEFDAIATHCGYANRSGAWKAWKRVLARLPIVETEQAREEAKQRINVLLAAVWEKAQAGDMLAIDRALALEKRRAELLGLDIVRSPAGRPPEEVRREYIGIDVADLISRANPPLSANGSRPDAVLN